MKVTDYIISFLIEKEIKQMFGYPGGVICHFIDSATKFTENIEAHATYHEQAAAFAACGYAQANCDVGVAYATSGPGATNLVTGIANAFFDSMPVLFFTGQVDTYGLRGDLPIRQRGFQETDVVSMVQGISKYAVRVDSPEEIRYHLEKAYYLATSGNPGPAVLDLPADVQRADVAVETLCGFEPDEEVSVTKESEVVQTILQELKKAERPCLLVGNGVKQSGCRTMIRTIIEAMKIPTVFSMPAFDVLPTEHPQNMGFIGANGHRYANFVLGKSDLILTVGSRMDLKQVGNQRASFAPQARIVRVDIDEGNLSYKVHEDECGIVADLKRLCPAWLEKIGEFPKCSDKWLDVCRQLKDELKGYDDLPYNKLLTAFGNMIPENVIMTADVGQSELWVAQNLPIKEGQRVYLSAGHGTMGYSLPAAIGASYTADRPVFSFSGDGGIQMNLQELQFVKRENRPIKVIVINNHALGMIRGFQEANFNKNYAQTIQGCGYSAPDFEKLAKAYDLPYTRITQEEDLVGLQLDTMKAELIEIAIPQHTLLNPNFGTTGKIQDQRPYMNRDLYDRLMEL